MLSWKIVLANNLQTLGKRLFTCSRINQHIGLVEYSIDIVKIFLGKCTKYTIILFSFYGRQLNVNLTRMWCKDCLHVFDILPWYDMLEGFHSWCKTTCIKIVRLVKCFMYGNKITEIIVQYKSFRCEIHVGQFTLWFVIGLLTVDVVSTYIIKQRQLETFSRRNIQRDIH